MLDMGVKFPVVHILTTVVNLISPTLKSLIAAMFETVKE